MLHLDVGQGGEASRAPVDDALGSIDQAVVIEPFEYGDDGAGQALIHREPLAAPSDRISESAHLTEDGAAGLGLPLPDALDERLAAQVVTRQALPGELPLDDVLGGDPRMVIPGSHKVS